MVAWWVVFPAHSLSISLSLSLSLFSLSLLSLSLSLSSLSLSLSLISLSFSRSLVEDRSLLVDTPSPMEYRGRLRICAVSDGCPPSRRPVVSSGDGRTPPHPPGHSMPGGGNDRGSPGQRSPITIADGVNSNRDGSRFEFTPIANCDFAIAIANCNCDCKLRLRLQLQIAIRLPYDNSRRRGAEAAAVVRERRRAHTPPAG